MKKILITLSLLLFFSPTFAREAGDVETFSTEPSYDHEQRSELEAELIKETEKLVFYGDKNWWDDLSQSEKDSHRQELDQLGEEFVDNIEGELTEIYGPIPDHPVSEEEKVSVLIHPMKKSAGGYFNSGDQYSKYQSPHSNERNLLYLDTAVLDYDDQPGFLAHEFTHLLVFNQKERLRGVREEVWLNEARAEFSPTILGYDDEYEDSNLDRRVDIFLRDPDTSLTEWIGQRADYGVVNIFTQYLVDHYGVEILIDSLKHDQVGIKSINHALEERGVEEDFHDVFNNFKVAVLVNDCSLGEKFCFKKESLKDLRVSPATNYMPYTEDSSLSVQYRTKNWAGNWHKITGGDGDLKLEFEIKEDVRVEIPYLLCDNQDECTIDFLETDEGAGVLEVEEFNSQYESLTIMPSVQEKISGFNGAEESFLFTWEASIAPVNEQEETLEKLNRLREILERLRDRLSRREQENDPLTCTIEGPLSVGSKNEDSVRCLQRFLRTDSEIYPEGYVTGNFGSLTEAAVKRFQEKYNGDILAPLNLKEGTGYVGVKTISKINNLR